VMDIHYWHKRAYDGVAIKTMQYFQVYRLLTLNKEMAEPRRKKGPDILVVGPASARIRAERM
jgi:hypothetical protein